MTIIRVTTSGTVDGQATEDSEVMTHLEGPRPLAADGSLIHPELGPQIQQTADNALHAAGAGPSDVVRSVVYVLTDDSHVLH